MQLAVNHIEKYFGARMILKDVQFHWSIGETVGVFGRNGSGKSTLMKILFGTMKAQSCFLSVDNKSFEPKKNISSKLIGYLPQESFLPKGMKVRNLIAMVIPDADAQNRIFYSPGVSSFENETVGALSLGVLKYFEFLLLANLNHPFLMLDEPFSMIDPLFHEVIKDIITSKLTTKGILLTDHYYNNVWQVTKRNFVLVDGSMMPVESKQDLVKYGYLSSRSS